MRDPYVHAEKTSLPGFGHKAIRALITDALGVTPDLPKTAGTGCSLRRPLASTSTVPEEITCLPAGSGCGANACSGLMPRPARSNWRRSRPGRVRRPPMTFAPRNAPTGRWLPGPR